MDEANVAFLMNMRLFSELDVMAGYATELIPLVLMPALDSLGDSTVRDAAAPNEVAGKSVDGGKKREKKHKRSASKCPFACMGRALGMANPHE